MVVPAVSLAGVVGLGSDYFEPEPPTPSLFIERWPDPPSRQHRVHSQDIEAGLLQHPDNGQSLRYTWVFSSTFPFSLSPFFLPGPFLTSSSPPSSLPTSFHPSKPEKQNTLNSSQILVIHLPDRVTSIAESTRDSAPPRVDLPHLQTHLFPQECHSFIYTSPRQPQIYEKLLIRTSSLLPSV